MKKFYVTTPIYYVNDVPHVGHAYSTIAADVLARFYRNNYGENNVFFLTGTDEHGQKVARAAEDRGLTPQEHVDKMVEPYKKLWKALDIKSNGFIRTTEPGHKEVVQAIFERLRSQEIIYPSKYEGWYCVHEETFYPVSQLKDGKCCPECGRQTEWVEEESYYFKASKYQNDIIKKIESDEFQILPNSRKNEVLSFLKGGLQDISVSRTAFKWGVEVVSDTKHVVYVWFDALINYLSGIGYHPVEKKQHANFKKFWPADVHIIGKDILKFHAVIWPAMLLALGIDLPRLVFAHGFLTLGGEKISKSKGKVIDPHNLIDKYGADAYRYFFMREFSFGLDGEYTEQTMIKRINADLANDLGNLVHRTANMMKKYFKGVIPEPTDKGDIWRGTAVKHYPEKTVKETAAYLQSLDFKSVLESIWWYVSNLNKSIEEAAPWVLKKEGREEELASVMYTLAEGIRIIAQLVYPFMPGTAQKIWEQLSMKGKVSEASIDDAAKWGILKPGSEFKVAEPLFPRIET